MVFCSILAFLYTAGLSDDCAFFFFSRVGLWKTLLCLLVMVVAHMMAMGRVFVSAREEADPTG